jgi:GNAT superfamily N-acetyltransferase
LRVDREALLAAYDEQIRRHPPVRSGCLVERFGAVVRFVCEGRAWSGVTWSSLEESTADAAIAEQIERFAGVAEQWEWKHYSYDRPADLPARLVAAGFRREEPETLMIGDVASLSQVPELPTDVELRVVGDEHDIEAMVSVHDEAFGDDSGDLRERLADGLTDPAGTMVAVLAWAGSTPVAGGRIEVLPGSDFAGLWGGGTVPAWRGRGIFRALVAYRVALAAARGCRWVHIDAMPPSRPILARLGFDELATTTPFKYPA